MCNYRTWPLLSGGNAGRVEFPGAVVEFAGRIVPGVAGKLGTSGGTSMSGIPGSPALEAGVTIGLSSFVLAPGKPGTAGIVTSIFFTSFAVEAVGDAAGMVASDFVLPLTAGAAGGTDGNAGTVMSGALLRPFGVGAAGGGRSGAVPRGACRDSGVGVGATGGGGDGSPGTSILPLFAGGVKMSVADGNAPGGAGGNGGGALPDCGAFGAKPGGGGKFGLNPGGGMKFGLKPGGGFIALPGAPIIGPPGGNPPCFGMYPG